MRTKAVVAALTAAGILALAPIGASLARQPSAFARLAGTWEGDGKVALQDGKSEVLKCRAFYTPREEGATMGLAIRCASASNKIELRATLTSKGEAIEGSWEERTYNAAGTVKGKHGQNQITLAITGGSFEGSMKVAISGKTHKVSIETKGIGLKTVNIDLARG